MKVSIVLDKRRMSTTGDNSKKFPIKIRLTYTRDKKTIQKLYSTGCYVTPVEFVKVKAQDSGRDQRLQEIEAKVSRLYENAKSIVRENPFIDHETFGYELTNAGSFKSPLSLMESYTESLKKEGRVGTAEYYRQAASSFKEFAGEHFTFGSVTVKWLMRYEKTMLENSKSITTVGMYCRALRTVFNLAIDRKKIPAGLYPFGKGKYVIPTAKGRKLALTEAQKDKILAYRTLAPAVQKAADMWIFSYLCYGMNFADIARLKFGDVKENKTIVFDRTKTRNTERDRTFIEIPLRPEAKAIIAKWGNKTLNLDSYVFPVLRDGLSPKQINDRVHDFIAETNEHLGTVSAELGLPKITTYWARHTFATIAHKKGADLETIQKALGHSDIKTTQAYINSFDMETRQMVSNWL